MRRYTGIVSLIVLIAAAGLFMSCAKEACCSAQESRPLSRLPEYEELDYNVKWLGVPVGMAKANINGIRRINGRDAYELVITVKTNAFCSRIYRIDDKYVSYLDAEKMYTLRHEVYRREGRYKKDAITDFDQVNHKAYYAHLNDGSKKVLDIPPAVHDPVSIAYYLRLVPAKVGDKKYYSVYNNESVYDLYGLIDKKALMNMPHMGRIWAFHLQPYAVLKGEVVKKGKASAYFSCDGNTPLMGVVEAPVFTKIVAYLARRP